MRLLVCGGAGFIGSNFVRVRMRESDDEIVVLDKQGATAEAQHGAKTVALKSGEPLALLPGDYQLVVSGKDYETEWADAVGGPGGRGTAGSPRETSARTLC